MKWYNVEFSRIGVLLFVGCLGLSMGAYVAGDFWIEEGCYTMFRIPVPHKIVFQSPDLAGWENELDQDCIPSDYASPSPYCEEGRL